MHQSQVFFNQDCPVCGRKMRVRIELLGKKVACGHCNAVTVEPHAILAHDLHFIEE